MKNTDEIRVASSKDASRIAIYLPVNTTLKLDTTLEDYDFTIIDLEHRRFGEASVTIEDNITTIGMHSFDSDVVIIGEKRR